MKEKDPHEELDNVSKLFKDPPNQSDDCEIHFIKKSEWEDYHQAVMKNLESAHNYCLAVAMDKQLLKRALGYTWIGIAIYYFFGFL